MDSVIKINTPTRKPRALIVEDDPFVLLDIEAMLNEMGVDVTGRAVSRSSALTLLATGEYDVATLDYELAGDTSEDVAHALRARNIPFVLVSGKVRYVRHTPAFRGFPALEKPVAEQDLSQTVQSLII